MDFQKKTNKVRLLSIYLVLGLAACGGGGDKSSSQQSNQNQNNATTFGTALKLQAAVPGSSYAGSLETCVKADSSANACTLGILPFINTDVFARGDTVPTVNDILSRTVVSHPWMAQRLEEVLGQMPADMLQLFGGVTAVVIAADIRPSFYTSRTGAIYLDPASFWLTIAEKQTIDTEEDFRAGFGDALNFVSLWRYVIGNDYAWRAYSLTGPETRTIDDIILPIASLLFHELAHANDIIPPTLVSTFSPAVSVAQAANSVASQNTATQLVNSQPLMSQLLKDLGQVLFQGVTATVQQQAISASEVGLEFEVDGASDDYAYSSQFEDVAMLFEEVMMKYHFGVDRELAYTDAPSDPDSRQCADYIVRWGFRNRLADPLVRSRAELVVQQLLNRQDVAAYFMDFAGPIGLIDGLDWCENLAAFPTSSSVGQQKPNATAFVPESDLRPIHWR